MLLPTHCGSSSYCPSSFRVAGLALLLLAGCGGSAAGTEIPLTGEPTPPAATEPAPISETPATAPTPKPIEITWGTCSIPVGGRSITVDCATVDLPARRGVEGAGTTEVAIYRLKSERQPATAQMWFLNGGPGGAGFGLAPFAQMVARLDQGIDAYLIDHRGTGESAFLDCPGAFSSATSLASFADACSREIRKIYGSRVDGFSTTESAHDVRELIDATATNAQKVFIYGGSYGSYWAHRLLQLPAVRVDAVVTDGNCLGASCSFDTPQDFGVDETMKFIFGDCKDDAQCNSRLGTDAFAFVTSTVQKLATGHCSTTKLAHRTPIELAFSIGRYWPTGLRPIFYRLDRCNPGDVAVLDTLESQLEMMDRLRLPAAVPILGRVPKPSEETFMSQVLNMHVVASEMISKPAPSMATLEAQAASLVFKPGRESFDLSYWSAWQGYPRDAYVDRWVDRDVPWLMMQGTYDFQTVVSLSTRAREHVTNPSMQFVRIDGGGHSVVFDSTCAQRMLASFLRSPQTKVDTSCVAGIKADALRMEAQYADFFLGTNELWD